jgi:uncharacterized membrane protein
MFWFILFVIGGFGLVGGYIAGRAGAASQARRLPDGDQSEPTTCDEATDALERQGQVVGAISREIEYLRRKLDALVVAAIATTLLAVGLVAIGGVLTATGAAGPLGVVLTSLGVATIAPTAALWGSIAQIVGQIENLEERRSEEERRQRVLQAVVDRLCDVNVDVGPGIADPAAGADG